VQSLVLVSDMGLDLAVVTGTGDNVQQWFCSFLPTEGTQEKDMRSLSSESSLLENYKLKSIMQFVLKIVEVEYYLSSFGV